LQVIYGDDEDDDHGWQHNYDEDGVGDEPVSKMNLDKHVIVLQEASEEDPVSDDDGLGIPLFNFGRL
jgi:hypothetical protein